MKATRGAAHQDWEFDGKTITVHIPMAWKRHGGRKVIIAPDGGDAWAPPKPRPDETLIRALARAHRWRRLIGWEVPVGGGDRRSGGRNSELRQPAATDYSAWARHRRGDPGGKAPEENAVGS